MRVDITPYIDRLIADLESAASGAGEEQRRAAERLGFALEPASRLALMEAISQACAEITSEMPSGGVDVRLDGRDLAFVVEAGVPMAPAAPTPPTPPAPPAPPAPPGEELEDGVARITLRLPESVKTRAEDAAARAGQSLNTWLVSVVRAATSEGAIHVDVDLSSIPGVPTPPSFPFNQGNRPGRRMTGWV